MNPSTTMDMAMNDVMPIHNSSVPATLSPSERPVGSLSARSAFAAHKDEIDRLDLAWAHYNKGHLSAVMGYLISDSVVSQAKSWRIDDSIKSGSKLRALFDEIDQAMPVDDSSEQVSKKLRKLFKSQLIQFSRLVE